MLTTFRHRSLTTALMILFCVVLAGNALAQAPLASDEDLVCCVELPPECGVETFGECVGALGLPIVAELCCGLEPLGDSCLGGACYTGPQGTKDVGECRAGEWRCEDGRIVCEGEVTPQEETCNFLDDDCDGQIDTGFDADGDGWTTCAGDCDDGDPTVNPGAFEICDGLDNDCDGSVDDGAPCPDDGNACTVDSCQAGQCLYQPVENGTVCDDGNPCTVASCNNGVCVASPIPGCGE